jgi:cystathionine gamma-synthase
MNPSIAMSSTFGAGGEVGYARESVTTWEAFEQALGALEGGQTLAFASGMAAVSAVLNECPVGAVIVAPQRMYTGVRQSLEQREQSGQLTVRLIDIQDPQAIASACADAYLLWLESPINPTMEVIDLRAAIDAAHDAGAVVVVDNTFATPLNQQPLALGADIVVHSVTKFLAGHSDVLMGAIVTPDEAWLERIRTQRTLGGAIPGPFETYLALRGLRTLAVRLRQAESNAVEIAGRLESHPCIERVTYPGLPSHPGHEVAARQMRGFGSMIAAITRGSVDEAEDVGSHLRLWTHATSLGGVESTLERRRRWPAEPDSVPANLLRLSVGIEDVEDLWADLDQALRAAIPH